MVTRFRKGDQVYGTTGFGFGGYAEHVCLPESPRGGVVAIKPVNLSYSEAATVPTGGLEALLFLRKAGSLSGRRVLIIGGRRRDRDLRRPALQALRGGGHGCGRTVPARTGPRDGGGSGHRLHPGEVPGTDDAYDVIFDVVGVSRLSKGLRALRRGGRYLLANPSLSAMIWGRWSSLTGDKKVVLRTARPKTGDLDFLRELFEAGQLRVVIDRRFPLEQTPDAHRYLDAGLARGRVVITQLGAA